MKQRLEAGLFVGDVKKSVSPSLRPASFYKSTITIVNCICTSASSSSVNRFIQYVRSPIYVFSKRTIHLGLNAYCL